MQNKKYLIPNGITLTSLVFGLVGMIIAMEGRLMQSQEKFTIAAWCIIISAICDFLDGFVARLTKTTSLFGMQFDSLCDLVAFGVAPSIIVYSYSLNDYKSKGIIMAVIFVCCGAVRLARFNVMALNKESLSLSLGLPIPLAAFQLISTILYFQQINMPYNQQKNLFAAFTIYLSIAMISNFEYISNKSVPQTQNAKIITVCISISILVSLFMNFYATLFYSVLIYCISGPIVSITKYVNLEEQIVQKNKNKNHQSLD